MGLGPNGKNIVFHGSRSLGVSVCGIGSEPQKHTFFRVASGCESGAVVLEELEFGAGAVEEAAVLSFIAEDFGAGLGAGVEGLAHEGPGTVLAPAGGGHFVDLGAFGGIGGLEVGGESLDELVEVVLGFALDHDG